MMYYGAIEAGGTKFVCAVSNEKFDIIDQIIIPTTTPTETIQHVSQFFDRYSITSIGIGSFGPIDINKHSITYGYITTTPKPGWGNFDFIGTIQERYNVPVAFTTDVNAAAYGEYKKGRAQNSESCLYLTVGTGIGGGAVVNGKILEGYGHPEMGHLLVNMHPDDHYQGNCSYHGTCLEGLASGPAIEGRYHKKGQELKNDKKVWEIEAYYIAQALVSYTLILRPEKIIIGGGVSKQKHLFPIIRKEFKKLLADYVSIPDTNNYILDPGLGDNSAIIGCLILAMEAL